MADGERRRPTVQDGDAGRPTHRRPSQRRAGQTTEPQTGRSDDRVTDDRVTDDRVTDDRVIVDQECADPERVRMDPKRVRTEGENEACSRRFEIFYRGIVPTFMIDEAEHALD